MQITNGDFIYDGKNYYRVWAVLMNCLYVRPVDHILPGFKVFCRAETENEYKIITTRSN